MKTIILACLLSLTACSMNTLTREELEARLDERDGKLIAVINEALRMRDVRIQTLEDEVVN